MRSRLRGLLQVDNVVPTLIIVVAVLVGLEPRIFGVEFSDRQIILALFALLGVNAVIERSGRLRKMDDQIDRIVHVVTGDISAGRILQNRSKFDRTETLEPGCRQERIRHNLNLLKNQLETKLSPPARRKCSLRVADRVFPVGVIGIDVDTGSGSLIVQHYLTGTSPQRAPLMWLRQRSEPEWFDCYLEQCNACFVDAREWRQ